MGCWSITSVTLVVVVAGVTWRLQMKESHCVSSQNALAVGGRKVELIEDRRGIINVLGGEMIRANHDAVGSRPSP